MGYKDPKDRVLAEANVIAVLELTENIWGQVAVTRILSFILRGCKLSCQATNIRVLETEVRKLSISSLIKDCDNYRKRERCTENRPGHLAPDTNDNVVISTS